MEYKYSDYTYLSHTYTLTHTHTHTHTHTLSARPDSSSVLLSILHRLFLSVSNRLYLLEYQFIVDLTKQYSHVLGQHKIIMMCF